LIKFIVFIIIQVDKKFSQGGVNIMEKITWFATYFGVVAGVVSLALVLVRHIA
jgi:hypothetical protein